MFKRDIAHNLRYYTWYFTLSSFISTLPIWVAFFLKFITIEQLALVTATGSLFTILLEIPTGALADLIGRRTTMFIGVMTKAIAYSTVPFLTSFGGFIVFVLLEGLGDALISGSDTALLYDTLKEQGKEEEFGAVFSKLLFYNRASIVVGSLVAGPLFLIWRGFPYVFRGFIYVLAAAFALLIVEPKIDSIKFSWHNYWIQTKQGIGELTKSSYMKKFVLYYILVGGITWSCLTYFNQPFAYDFNWTPPQMSNITAIAYLVSSTALYLLTANTKLLTQNVVYIGFPIIMSLGFLPALLVNKYLAIGLMIIIQLAGSGRFSLLERYAHKEFTSKNRATALSTLNMSVSILMTILIFAGGNIQGIYDTRYVFFGLGILTLTIILPLALILVSDHKKLSNTYNAVDTT